MQIVVEYVYEDRERHVSLALGSRAREHEVTARVAERRELREQAGFPDSRLANELEYGAPSMLELG